MPSVEGVTNLKAPCGGLLFNPDMFDIDEYNAIILKATPGPELESVPDSTASDVAGIVSDFNNLLAVLRRAGVIARN